MTAEKQSDFKMGGIDIFSKEDINMTIRHVKRCSTSQIIRKTQVKATVKHLTPLRTAVVNRQETTGAGGGVQKRENLYMFDGNMNQYNPYGKQYEYSLKN